MPNLISDAALDAALAVVQAATRLDICSQSPVTYTEATSTYTVGNKITPTIGAAADRSPNGRKVSVSTFADGTITATATASHWALVKVVGTTLVASGSLSATQAVTSGNTFSLTAFDIGIPDAV